MDTARFVFDLLKDNPNGVGDDQLMAAYAGATTSPIWGLNWAVSQLLDAGIVARIGGRLFLQRPDLGGD